MMYTFTLSQIIVLYSCVHDANEFTNASFMSMTMLAICAKMYNMFSNRKIIIKMIRVLESDTFKPRDSEEFKILNKIHRRIK